MQRTGSRLLEESWAVRVKATECIYRRETVIRSWLDCTIDDKEYRRAIERCLLLDAQKVLDIRANEVTDLETVLSDQEDEAAWAGDYLEGGELWNRAKKTERQLRKAEERFRQAHRIHASHIREIELLRTAERRLREYKRRRLDRLLASTITRSLN